MKIYTTHLTARMIAACCRSRGVEHAVFSPGSRSAPLVFAFEEIDQIQKTIIPDERSAAYSALGIALSTGKPVAIITTSGTAVLNSAPAICEAFYLGVPLIMITADRPHGSVFSGENQTIVQEEIYSSFVKKELHIPSESTPKNTLISKICQCIDYAIIQNGPVHINIALDEPLYATTQNPKPIIIPKKKSTAHKENIQSINRLEKIIRLYPKRIWFDGLSLIPYQLKSMNHSVKRNPLFVELKEPLSNTGSPGLIPADELFHLLMHNPDPELHPDLLITREGQILSKKFRLYFKKFPPKLHVHISESPAHWYRFNCPFENILFPRNKKMTLRIKNSDGDYFIKLWQQKSREILSYRENLSKTAPWSEWKMITHLAARVPLGSVIHFGNSGAIRYATLHQWPENVHIHANRGTSGIDGSLSTVCGAASVSDKKHICVIGDISFRYDNNALWREKIPQNLKIIVVNNGGGNIFRMIPGPSKSGLLEKYFLTDYPFDLKKWTESIGIPYSLCKTEKSWIKWLQNELNKPGCSVVEVRVDGEKSAALFSNYYQHLNFDT